MLRHFHLILAALALLVAPVAMQSGAALAAMPAEHHEMAQAEHCGDEGSGNEITPDGMAQCCVAMCSALALLAVTPIETPNHLAPGLYAFEPTDNRAFLARLPTPPPKLA